MLEATEYDSQKDRLRRFLSASQHAVTTTNCQLPLHELELLARRHFLDTVQVLTPKEISRIASRSISSPMAILDSWKRDNQIFSLSHEGSVYYPAFQFFQGRPRRPIGKVLRIFGPQSTYWPIAFWFVSASKALDGASPADVLASDWRLMLMAARCELLQKT